MLIPAVILRNPVKNCFGWVGVQNLSFLFRSNHLRNPSRNSLCMEVRRKLHRNLDQIFILYSLPIPTLFDDHHISNIHDNKANAAHLLCFIMESGSDNGNPFGHYPKPPIGIIVHIPNIPTKKSSRKCTTSCRQPCQHPSFARPAIR